MPEFRDELQAWLSRHPDEQFRRLGEQSNYDLLARFWLGNRRYSRDREETEKIMAMCMGPIAEALSGDEGAWGEVDSSGNGETLGDYAWEPNDEDGFMPEGQIWMATEAVGGRRIVLWAVLGGYVCFIAESQANGPPWRLEKQWGRTSWARPRVPRTVVQIQGLTNEVIAWIATETATAASLRPAAHAVLRVRTVDRGREP